MSQNNIRVVHYKNSFLPLTENWIYNQVTGLNGTLANFYAIYRRNKESFPFDKLRCIREDLNYFELLPNRTFNRLFHRYPQFLLWLLKDRPDIIHAHFGPCGYYILPYASLLNIPLITSFYGYDAYLLPKKEPCWQNKYKKLFRRGRLFLVEGPAMRDKLIELGCNPEKVVVHHIGIKLGKYEFRERKLNNKIRLLACGRFVEKKGTPYAIQALKQVMSKTKADVHLTIVGDSDNKGTPTIEKRKILNYIDKYQVANAVTMTGYLPHDKVLKIAYDHHIFLAPSVHASDGDAEGGFPVILTEVLATGMPVVAFEHCDIPEIIQDGKSGFLVPERDVDTLAEKLTYLIEHPEVWPEMGRSGRAYVEANYDIEKLNERLIKLYQKLLEK